MASVLRNDGAIAGRRFTVPGSTSNLGPGFDALGLALRIYLDVTVTAVEDDGRGALRFTFEDRAPAGVNAIERAIRYEAARRGLTLPSLALHVCNAIPVQAGLGSSAAAIVAGLRIVESLAPLDDPWELLAAATALEGHPDNVSASLLGGLTACTHDEHGCCALACDWPERVAVVVGTPAVALATAKARGVLPATVSRADAVFNVQRAALLLQAVHTGEIGLLREALQDRLHQPARAALVPGLAEALTWRHPSLLGAFLSGAGPSIAAFVLDDPAPIVDRFTRLFADRAIEADVRVLGVHPPDPGRRALVRRAAGRPSGALV